MTSSRTKVDKKKLCKVMQFKDEQYELLRYGCGFWLPPKEFCTGEWLDAIIGDKKKPVRTSHLIFV